ncbi:MAG: primosomal protein N' [Deltaproteobacteria bacterium]|nr:primosomal protein N' [Deltaproteobacteria bacterium]
MDQVDLALGATTAVAKVAQVVVPRPLPGPLSYLVPDELEPKVREGSLVQVPFRSRVIEGFVVGFTTQADPSLRGVELKEILSVPFDRPVFSTTDLEFFNWIGDYYQLPIGEVFNSAFPRAIFKQPKRAKKPKPEDESDAKPATAPAAPAVDVELTSDQAAALASITRSISAREFRSFLLYGVTGSGKTEVYIRAARAVVDQGRTALILVPEIALTPQLRKRFEDRFDNQVAVLHSGLTEKTRREFWWDILRGRRKVVVGARSALFAPLVDIGLIVVDEEHEPSYKQEDRLRYSARDLALVRARQHRAAAILGSATPSIETFYAAERGKHQLLALKTRPAARPMPRIEVVDLRQEYKDALRGSKDSKLILGRKMREELADTLIRKEQSMVFVNRKGFSSFVLCGSCGEVPKCLNCSVSLTYYQRARQMRCHYCALTLPAIEQCPKCQAYDIKLMGMGTELVEDEVRRLFPSARIERLDAETADTIKKIEAVLDRFRRGEIDILVGTQMLAKGHDFPNVTLVAVVLADLNLHLPDFRAGERTFQLLAQVSGRAGRGDKPGRVVLQTMLPDHYVIQAAAKQDYAEFYRAEIEFRQQFGYPPFSRMAQLEFRDLKEDRARDQAERARQLLDHLDPDAKGFSYLGPAAASIARIANQYRWQILVRSEKSSALNAVIKTLRKEGVRFIDVDPVTTL